MKELTFENLTKRPEHQKSAERFIEVVMGEISPHFEALKITAVNQTEEDLNLFPGIIEAVKFEGDNEIVKVLSTMDSKTEARSAFCTEVFILILGNEIKLINKAARKISKKARQLNGEKTTDRGVNYYGPKKAMEKTYGKRPDINNLPLYQCYLGYTFGTPPPLYIIPESEPE